MKTKGLPRVFTVGHSNRSIQDFLSILKAYKLKYVVDVRTIPKSGSNPQFGKERLEKTLAKHNIQYEHMQGLGGFRKTTKDSPNKGWRNTSFRGYADYMLSPEFHKNLRKLISKSKRKRLVIMCAEALPWRCHRSLIDDALLVQKIRSEEILSEISHRTHKLTPFAKVKGTKLTYPKDDGVATLRWKAP